MEPGSLPASLRDDAWRRSLAGAILHAQFTGRTLPAHLAGIPDHQLVDRLARMDAKEILATLKELYGLEWWDVESFERAFVEGALSGWRPGTLVQHPPGRLRIVSTTCPIAADIERDPRLCASCQHVQKHAAFLALIGQVESVEFGRLMSKGESACELNVKLRSDHSGRK